MENFKKLFCQKVDININEKIVVIEIKSVSILFYLWFNKFKFSKIILGILK